MIRKIFLVFGPVFLNSAFADVGYISILKGKADVLRDTKVIKAKLNTIIENKDKISTKKRTKLQIAFKDKTLVTLGSSSTF